MDDVAARLVVSTRCLYDILAELNHRHPDTAWFRKVGRFRRFTEGGLPSARGSAEMAINPRRPGARHGNKVYYGSISVSGRRVEISTFTGDKAHAGRNAKTLKLD